MSKDELLEDLPGADRVIAWFGAWPNFHDTEVTELRLDRGGLSFLTIYTFNTTAEITPAGFYRQEKHALVTFRFGEILGCNLDGFNYQNVVFDLEIDREPESFRLTLSPCYGLAGHLLVKSLSVELAMTSPSHPEVA